MTDEMEKMANEKARVLAALDAALTELETEGGDLRFFSAALLMAAFRLHADIEGPQSLVSAVTAAAVRVAKERGVAGTA
ncbi:hypothetical protein ACFORG_07300 [Lutimaribacter marinistellae]|uniref:Uncharacterized protein n=1 Tax=Lutimaribacter marinistellae TaxID=1820329 RepID=A0ABV7TED9_9RHOB